MHISIQTKSKTVDLVPFVDISNASLKVYLSKQSTVQSCVKSPLQPSIEINSPRVPMRDDTRIDSKLDNVSIYKQIGIDSDCLCT